MKLLTLLMLISLISCVSPRDKRALYSGTEQTTDNTTGNNSSDNSSNVNESGDGTSVPIVDGSDSGSTGGTNSNVPAEIRHCNWSTDGSTGFENTSSNMESYSLSHLGENTICQSKNTQSDIYVQLKNATADVRVCVIPTYEQNGRSIYLGEARCQFVDSNKKIYKFPLLKNRDYGRYQNFAINSVMVMKEQTFFFDSPFYREQITYDAYFICSVNLDLYGDSSYCDAFRQKGQYFYKKL